MRIESRKDRAYNCGCNTESLRDALVHVFSSHLSAFETQYYPSQENMLICPHSHVSACKKTKHTMNRCYKFLVKYIYIIYYCPHNTSNGLHHRQNDANFIYYLPFLSRCWFCNCVKAYYFFLCQSLLISNILLSSLAQRHTKDGGGNIATDERPIGVKRILDNLPSKPIAHPVFIDITGV